MQLHELDVQDRARLFGGAASQETKAVAKAPKPTLVTFTITDAHGRGGTMAAFESVDVGRRALESAGFQETHHREYARC